MNLKKDLWKLPEESRFKSLKNIFGCKVFLDVYDNYV